MLVRALQVVAVILAIAGVYFVWQADKDAAFVSLVLAACAFFLTIRFQAKERLSEREPVAPQHSTDTDAE